MLAILGGWVADDLAELVTGSIYRGGKTVAVNFEEDARRPEVRKKLAR